MIIGHWLYIKVPFFPSNLRLKAMKPPFSSSWNPIFPSIPHSPPIPSWSPPAEPAPPLVPRWAAAPPAAPRPLRRPGSRWRPPPTGPGPTTWRRRGAHRVLIWRLWICISIYLYLYVYSYIHIYIYLHIYIYVCMYACMHVMAVAFLWIYRSKYSFNEFLSL